MRKLHYHDYKKHRRGLAWEIKLALLGQLPPEPLSRARVTVERRSVGVPDHDGLVGGLKPLIDCLLPLSKRHPSGLGVIADDKPSVLELIARPVRVAHLVEQGTTVIIEDLGVQPA